MSAIEIIRPRHRLLTGLIGAPIKHSAAPAMHETAAAALGIRCFYQLMEIAGADRATLTRLIDGLRLGGFDGFNVTFPYKEAIVPLLDGLSPQAAAIGAVNTVVVKESKLIGYNTDATGFARVSADLVAGNKQGAVALIGAGGVGRAAAFALAEQGVKNLRIFDQDPAKAQALVAALKSEASVCAVTTIEAALEGAVGLVNGTPVGMWPSIETPVPRHLLHDGLWVADAVYSPLWTPLLLAAKAAGAEVVTGRELAVWQAVDAFRLFSCFEAAPDVMRAAFDHIMAERTAADPPINGVVQENPKRGLGEDVDDYA